MIRSILLLAIVLPAAFGSAVQAGPVRIDGFEFGCETPAGQRLKPQFGDMDGMFYSEIAGNENACVMAVKRRIANCHQHTRFLSPGDNRKYPQCLPIFQQQAKACDAHFRRELNKCGAGAAGGEQGAESAGHKGKGKEPSCAEVYGQGWQEMCMALPPAQRDPVIKHMGLKPGPSDGCGGRPDWSFCGKP